MSSNVTSNWSKNSTNWRLYIYMTDASLNLESISAVHIYGLYRLKKITVGCSQRRFKKNITGGYFLVCDAELEVPIAYKKYDEQKVINSSPVLMCVMLLSPHSSPGVI